MEFKYSVIIPHRDSFSLLQVAIASIPDRADIQIVVIDNSLTQVDFTNLKVKHNAKLEVIYSDTIKGAGHARNEGLKIAKGEWVLFLDADDFFTTQAFDAFDKYSKTVYDIVFFASTSVVLNTTTVSDRHLVYANLVTDFVKGKNNAEDNLRYRYVTPWGKLIKSKLIFDNNIWFDEVPASNDLMFSVKTGHFANSIFADGTSVYCITTSSGSLTRTITTINSRSRFMASIRQYQFMNAIGRPELRFMLMSQVLSSINFGFKEFLWYLKMSYKEKVNIFLGSERWSKLIINKIMKKSKS